MDHNTENVIIEIVKRPRGRPRLFTEEEQKEKVRIQSRKYYQQICEKKKKMLDYIILKIEMLYVSENDYII